MPQRPRIVIGKAEMKGSRMEEGGRIIVHKVYIEWPVGKRLRFLKTYCTTKMIMNKKAFGKYVQTLIDMDMERLEQGIDIHAPS